MFGHGHRGRAPRREHVEVAVRDRERAQRIGDTLDRARVFQRLDGVLQVDGDTEKARVGRDQRRHPTSNDRSVWSKVVERAPTLTTHGKDIYTERCVAALRIDPASAANSMNRLVSPLYVDVRADTIGASRAMADLSSLLSVIEHDPDDTQAFEALVDAAQKAPPDLRASRLAATRKLLATRGRPDAVVQLIDVEIAAIGDTDKPKQADLLLEKGMVLDGELLDVAAAHNAFASVLELRKNDAMAIEALEELNVA